MNKIKKYFSTLLGADKDFESEQLLLISFLLTGIFMSVFALIVNALLGFGWIMITITVSIICFLLIIYGFAIRKKFVVLSMWLTSLLIFTLLNLMWLFNAGSNGPIPLIFVIIFSFFIYMYDGLNRIIFTLLYFAMIVMQFCIEYYSPGLIVQYTNYNVRIFDFYSSILMYIGLSGVLMVYLKKIYKSENAKAKKSDHLKSAFLANMSHEIRTPMNGIIGFSQLLKKPGLSKEKQDKYVNTIIDSANHLLTIVNDILDISKIETGQIEIVSQPTNINELLLSLIEHYTLKAEEKGITIKLNCELKENEYVILTDKPKLKQILNNLISNAIKFTSEGHIIVGCNSNKDSINFFVEDTGIGVPKEFQREIFERFRQVETTTTRNFGGTGLGLAISKNLVELLGGKLWLESEIGKGSIFRFAINKTIVVPPNIKLNKDIDLDSIEPKPVKQTTILIAEDEDNNYFYLSEALSDIGIKVLRAKDGLEAIKLTNNYPEISLILMDIKMPELNGYSATKLIKERYPNLPIIAQTAYALTGEKEKILNEGFDGYISKPIRLNELFKILNKYI
jgi:signal transduction histidine kinase/CheY-like chemotaxis protein